MGTISGTIRALFLFCICASYLHISEGQLGSIVTPPPDNTGRPVVANGIVYFLHYIGIPAHCLRPRVDTYRGGGIIKDNRAFMVSDSPHEIHGNIEIAPSGCVYIEPGTEMRFAAGFGMIINGTLISRGSEEPGKRIVMTKLEGSDTGHPSGDWNDDIRLVDGNTTQDGQLNLLYRDKWRGICTNYVNFTAIDANVTCRQLGFLKGNFTYHSFAKNYTDYMLFEKPSCDGTEKSLFECPGAANIKVGHHICDGQQLVGFQCEGLRDGLAVDHWRGLEFYNSSNEEGYLKSGDNVYLNYTHSWVEYTDILYAGLDIFHGKGPDINYQRASISASPLVPIFNNVTVNFGAYDAFNFTNAEGPIHIANCTMKRNRGYGIYVHTAVGDVLVNQTNITENWGDGIKMYMSNLTYYDFNFRFPNEESFCYTPILGLQTYPIYVYQDVVDPDGDKPLGTSCTKSYKTLKDKKIVVHFLDLIRDPEATAYIEVYDLNMDGPPIGHYEVSNGSLPQSITTKTNIAYIKFVYSLPRGLRCETFKPCIRFLLRVSTANETENDFRLILSQVSNNIGYGVNIQEMRNRVFFNTSEVCDNHYGAGIRVYQGAGEVTVNNTLIQGNQGAGINITYSGGYQLLNNTRIVGNKGYGMITEYLLLNKTRIENQQIMEVVRAKFELNEWRSLRIGNYCRGGYILVNESYFAYNMDEAIEYLSCNISTPKETNFSVAYNKFESNYRHAIFVRPMINTVGIISNNTFMNHSLGAVLIDNGYDLIVNRWYRPFMVNYDIFENTFRENTGRYAVKLRLTQNSPFQKMYVKFNKFIENSIQDSFMYLNPRSRANAVIIVSSSNIELKRNWIQNPDSVREIATHLVDPSVTIDGTENWWGVEVTLRDQLEPIHAAIFDQDDRYNLALINYFPVLKTERLYDNILSDNVPRFLWRFSRPGNTIGGVLEENDFTASDHGVYHVDRDIIIKTGRTLTLGRGVVLQFESSVGMVVHGCLKADGQQKTSPVVFQNREDPDMLAVENRTASVRLVDGMDEYEGRLEVEIDGEWGTVCSQGWTDQNSLLVCQQLGLTFNPELSMKAQKEKRDQNQRILLSWVSCEEEDIDLTHCRAVRDGEHLCTHDQDVFVRCQPSSWSGITIPATPKDGQACTSQLRHLHIEQAGLLDHATMAYTPALRIDYNYYQISYVKVTSPLQDGIHIKFNHPYTENLLEYANITDALGNGLVIRSPQINIRYSRVTNSRKAGFLSDPFFSEYDALLVRNSISAERRTYMEDRPTLRLGDREMIFLLTRPGSGNETKAYYCELSVAAFFKVTLQLLDYSPRTNIEKVTVYDSNKAGIGATTKSWEIEEDLIDFPVVSTDQYLTIKLQVNGGVKTGRLSFAAVSYQQKIPVMKTNVVNCTFEDNMQGIVTKHYNNPSNYRMELYHRHSLETFVFERVNVYRSKQQAMFMPSVTKYNEDYIPTWEEMTIPQRVATIEYTIDQCNFYDNQYGILAEHNHVDFANNVWHWVINRAQIKRTAEGGLEIELPRVNDEEGSTKKHKVSVSESVLDDNYKFAFTIAGYYANVTIKSNTITNNYCRKGLITISGMEKDMFLSSNKLEFNTGVYMIDFDIISHSEYSATVSGLMELNEVMKNRHFPEVVLDSDDDSPKTFAVAFRGLQNMTAHKNLFENSGLKYELVAATTALYLGNHIDVQRNWWGSTNIYDIRLRIFDFDDWNNYAIADYHPYLTRSDVNSDPAVGDPVEVPLDLNQLGGRVFTSLNLPYRGDPYPVVSDLTIMPDATLTISPGTELQFKANVGILVLGRLEAQGLTYDRIKMSPLPPSRVKRAAPQLDLVDDRLEMDMKRVQVTAERLKRAAEEYEDLESPESREKRQASESIRLTGDEGLFKDQGFLEMYNTSTQRWNMMCDNQFNEKTAEVVCRALGKETINVRVRFTHLYDHYIHGKPQFTRKEFWTFSYYCNGDETSLDQCQKRYNYRLLPCIYAANYTFITCGKRNLNQELNYWGNIRFASNSYQEKFNIDDRFVIPSNLENVDIVGAGMLHGEKVGAIQTTYVTPVFKNINITNCASNGYDIIAPRDKLQVRYQNVTGNLGYGVNVLVLNGESGTRDSSFTPLGISTIPYHVYGLVDICRMEKEISLDNRMLLYYKYSHKAVDCVKIIRSSNQNKQVGVRFLQLNLFQEDFSRNMIEIFNGRESSRNHLLKEILANSSSADTLRLYVSTGDVISVHIHASVSFHYYGFVAEVVTIPQTGLTYPDSNYLHVLEHSAILSNQDGALQYKNVGEINPSLFIEHCWLEGNGVAILNLTSPPTIDISLQGTKRFDFNHNYVSRNKGGMYFSAHTQSIASALKGNMTNNVFAYGTHGEALNITGHYYERIFLFQNYFYNYTTGDYRDVIHIKDVVVNFTYNIVAQNVGHYILAAYNYPDPQARQIYTRCGFNDNNATANYESTIKVGAGRPVFHHNYLVNELNDFEMQASSRVLQNELPINATENWWGSDRRAFINGKIWDGEDNALLSRVEFIPAKLDNRSVIDGNCKPGWKLDEGRCYRYMGGALPYYEANEFCKANGGFLAELRKREDFLRYVARLMQAVNEPNLRVWVMGEVRSGYCAALERNYLIIEEDCTRLLYPFICEKDPYLTQPPEVADYLRALAIGLGVGIGGLILIIITIFLVLMCVKSKRREKERFERAASIRSSIRGSMRSKSQLTLVSNATSRYRMNDFGDEMSQRSYATKTSRGTSIGTSQNSIAKSQESIAKSQHSIANSHTSLESAPRPATGRTTAHLRNPRPLHNKGYHHDDSVVDDDDDGFDDTFDDDDQSVEDIKVSLENPPRVRNGHLRHAGSQEVNYNFNKQDEEEEDDDDDEDEDEEDEKSYHRKSLTSFSAPESPEASPIKNTIFLPRSNNSLAPHRLDYSSQPLPTPPPTPPVYNRYGNVPTNQPQQHRYPLYDDVPSESSSNQRYGNVPGYSGSPSHVAPRSTPDLYADVPSESSNDRYYSNVPGYSPSQPQSDFRSTPNLYDDVPSESGSDRRYNNVPGYHPTPTSRPQVQPRTQTPDLVNHTPRSNTPQFRDSPRPSPRVAPRLVPRSQQNSPAHSVDSRNSPVPAPRPDRGSPAPTPGPMVVPSPRVQVPPSPLVQGPPIQHPQNVRYMPRDNVLYLQQHLHAGQTNEDSVETEI